MLKLKNKYEVNLYSVFANEKARVGDQFTVSYNNKKQQVKYQLEGKGALTVKFGRDVQGANREDFYYSPEGDSESMLHTNILCDNGKTGRIVDDKFFDIPKEFRKIFDDYRDKENGVETRKAIGIDKAQAEAKKHKVIINSRPDRYDRY